MYFFWCSNVTLLIFRCQHLHYNSIVTSLTSLSQCRILKTNDHSKHQIQKLYNTILQLCLSKKNLASTVQAAVRILELYHAPAITFSTTLNLRKVQNLRHENYSIECDFALKHFWLRKQPYKS